MTNGPEVGFKQPEEKGQSEVGSLSFEELTTKDKIDKLIDNDLDVLCLANLRSPWGRRELTRVLAKAEEMGNRRGFAEGVIEEQVQDTCNDIVGNMLAKIDDGKKSGATVVSLDKPVEEQDVTITRQAIIRAKKIFNNAELPTQAGIYTSQNEEGDTLFNMSFIIDLQNDQPESAETLTPES